MVIRRVPMLFRLAGTDGVFPALSIEALRVAQGASSYRDQVVRRQPRGVVRRAGPASSPSRPATLQVRTDARGRMILYDTGHRSERFVSARRRAEGNGAGRQDRWPDRLHRHQRDRAEGHAQHAGRGCRARRRGPCPARRADARAGLPRPAGFRRRRGVPLSRRSSASLFVLLLPRLSAGRMAIVAAIFIGIGLVVPWLAFSEYDLLFDPIYPPVDAGGDLRQRHGAGLHAHRARARGDPRRLRPLPVARRGRAGRAPSRAAAARRRAARDHRDVHRRARLHAHLRAVRSAGPDAVHEPLPDADDRPHDEPPAAPSTNTWATRSWRSGTPRSPSDGHAARACDTALAMQARLHVLNEEWQRRGRGGRARAHPGGHRHRPQHRPGLGRQFRLRAALDLFLPGRRREPRLAARRAVQDLPRSASSSATRPASRRRVTPPSSSTSSW